MSAGWARTLRLVGLVIAGGYAALVVAAVWQSGTCDQYAAFPDCGDVARSAFAGLAVGFPIWLVGGAAILVGVRQLETRRIKGWDGVLIALAVSGFGALVLFAISGAIVAVALGSLAFADDAGERETAAFFLAVGAVVLASSIAGLALAAGAILTLVERLRVALPLASARGRGV